MTDINVALHPRCLPCYLYVNGPALLQGTNIYYRDRHNICVVVCRADLQAYTKTKTDEIVNLNNTISRLKKQLETYEAESYAQETKKDYSLQVASQKTLEYGQASAVMPPQFFATSVEPQQAVCVLLLVRS